MGAYCLICTLHHAALQLFTQDWWAGTRSDFFYRLWETLWGRRGEGLLRVSANRCRGCLDSLYHSGDLSQGLRAESCPISLGKFSVYTLPGNLQGVPRWAGGFVIGTRDLEVETSLCASFNSELLTRGRLRCGLCCTFRTKKSEFVKTSYASVRDHSEEHPGYICWTRWILKQPWLYLCCCLLTS